jgi:hypothetical protein
VAHPVVQVAAQPPARLLPRRDDPLAGALQVRRQQDRVGGRAGLARQVLQQPMVGARERLARRARRDDQLAERLPLVDERQPQQLAGRRAGRGRDRRFLAPPKHDRRVGQLQRLAHGLHQRRRDGLGRERPLEPLAEPRERRVRVVGEPLGRRDDAKKGASAHAPSCRLATSGAQPGRARLRERGAGPAGRRPRRGVPRDGARRGEQLNGEGMPGSALVQTRGRPAEARRLRYVRVKGGEYWCCCG